MISSTWCLVRKMKVFLGNHLNKSLSTFFYLLIDKYFTAEGNESKWSGNESVRIGNITSVEQEKKMKESLND